MISISDAEAQVMEVLWGSEGPHSAEDIAKALVDLQDWQLATIKTLLNRLFNKGAISAEQLGRRYLYTALLQRDDWVAEQSMGLLDRLFGGSLTPLVAHFSNSQRRLKPGEVAALKKLLKDYKDD